MTIAVAEKKVDKKVSNVGSNPKKVGEKHEEKRKMIPIAEFTEVFTRLCRDGKHIGEIAETLGISEAGVIARSNEIRKRQLALAEKERMFVLPKPKRRPRSGMDLQEVNKLLASKFGVTKEVVTGPVGGKA